jgi:hypothetical protein
MSKPDTKQRQRQPINQPPGAAAGTTRIDAPHVSGEPPADSGAEPVAPANAASVSAPAAEPIQAQAAQLAGHLRARQKDLDHREAQLNARVAQLERDVRTARLWLGEREADLERRDQELTGREHQLDEQLGRLLASDAQATQCPTDGEPKSPAERVAQWAAAQKRARQQWETERRRAEDALRYERQQLAARREASQRTIRQMLGQLDERRKGLEAREARLKQVAAKPRPELLAREETVRRTAEMLQARQRRLDQAEAQLAQAHVETEKLREQLREARREAQAEARAQRQRLAAEHRQALADLDEKRRVVERRADHVDQCRLALEKLRGELGSMHRETLEIRLATEELWVQLSGAAPPAALTRSLGRIRTKLADHYRLANAELKEQKQELENLRNQLAEQHEKLLRQKEQFDGWIARRREETDKQAARLVAREAEFDRREAELKDRAERWQVERLGYQQEIRRLRHAHDKRQRAAVPA